MGLASQSAGEDAVQCMFVKTVIEMRQPLLLLPLPLPLLLHQTSELWQFQTQPQRAAQAPHSSGHKSRCTSGIYHIWQVAATKKRDRKDHQWATDEGKVP